MAAEKRSWLLLVYKVPPDPTARRVYVWRKLKRLGAILLHDAVWALPPTAYTREQLQWLTTEIVEMSGEALLWEVQLMSAEQDEVLMKQFIAQADAAYRKSWQNLRNRRQTWQRSRGNISRLRPLITSIQRSDSKCVRH